MNEKLLGDIGNKDGQTIIPSWEQIKYLIVENSNNGNLLREKILTSKDPAILFEAYAGIRLDRTPRRGSTKIVREEFLTSINNQLKILEKESDFTQSFTLAIGAINHISGAQKNLDRQIRFAARVRHFMPEQLESVCRVGGFSNPTKA